VRGVDVTAAACHTFRVTRWENRDERVPRLGDAAECDLLVARLHVDLQRVSSAVCPRA
jgi:hypothetical protein